MHKYKATIFIPTYNGEEYLNDLLRMCYKQKFKEPYEVFIIDSGSTDKTLSIIKKYKKVRLQKIKKEEFGHGKTRQLATEMSDSEFMVFLTQDAVPAHEHWLSQMLYPFEIGEKVIAVLGRQSPRPFGMPITKRDVRAVFDGLGMGHFLTVQSSNPLNTDAGSISVNQFFSNVNAAYRRDFLINEIGIPEVDYGEDMAFSKKLFEAGYFKVYAPQGCVVHSHTYSIEGYRQRMTDETKALSEQGFYNSCISFYEMLNMVQRGTRQDIKFIIHDKDYSTKRKLYWIALTPGYNWVRQHAIYTVLKDKFSEGIKSNQPIEPVDFGAALDDDSKK